MTVVGKENVTRSECRSGEKKNFGTTEHYAFRCTILCARHPSPGIMFDDELTPAQQRVLDYIVGFSRRHGGRFPRGSQIANEFGFTSSSSAYEHLLVLQRKGYIAAPKEGGWRRYRLTDKATSRPRGLPLLGSIPAGPTWYAEDVEAEWISGIDDLFPNAKAGDFLLTVDGDSMIGAGLESGMLALLRPNIVPAPRAICAVWVEGDGGTLKRVVPDGDVVRLVPENADFTERIVGAEDVIVQGVLQSALSITHFN